MPISWPAHGEELCFASRGAWVHLGAWWCVLSPHFADTSQLDVAVLLWLCLPTHFLLFLQNKNCLPLSWRPQPKWLQFLWGLEQGLGHILGFQLVRPLSMWTTRLVYMDFNCSGVNDCNSVKGTWVLQAPHSFRFQVEIWFSSLTTTENITWSFLWLRLPHDLNSNAHSC